MGYIYKITNDINNKIYIGQTVNSIESRFREHWQDNRQDNNKFHNALHKYGKEHFTIEQVEKCENDQLNEREKYWIKYYDSVNTGYNTTWGGSNGIQYNREKLLSLWNSGLNIKKISDLVGIDRGLLSNILKEHNISSEDINKRRYKAASHQKKNRKVYQIDVKTGNIIKQWDSINNIEKELGINHSLIIACCLLKPQHKTAGGYAWRYVEDYNSEQDKNTLIKYSRRIPKNSKTILQYDKNGVLIGEYCNSTEVFEQTGICPSSITKYCRGERTDSHGYIWKYKEN